MIFSISVISFSSVLSVVTTDLLEAMLGNETSSQKELGVRFELILPRFEFLECPAEDKIVNRGFCTCGESIGR
jgi:hypothetical protein